MSEQSRADFEQRILEMANDNPDFRKHFTEAPKAAISELLKVDLPPELNVVVHEEDENTLHFVLPAVGDSLSDSELASVSGGWNVYACWSDDT